MPDSSTFSTDLIRGKKPASLILFALLVLLLTSALGCDRNIEPYQPGEEPSAPDLARIFPGPPPGSSGPEGQAVDTGQTPRGAVPPSRAEGSEVAAAASAGAAPISGEITIAAEVASAQPAGGVLFVIARPQGMTAGPPLAVLRIPSPDFPLSFSIGPENVMIPSMQFAGQISLSARLDADGNAMTRTGGDISSAVVEALTPGTTGVSLSLSERS